MSSLITGSLIFLGEWWELYFDFSDDFFLIGDLIDGSYSFWMGFNFSLSVF